MLHRGTSALQTKTNQYIIMFDTPTEPFIWDIKNKKANQTQNIMENKGSSISLQQYIQNMSGRENNYNYLPRRTQFYKKNKKNNHNSSQNADTKRDFHTLLKNRKLKRTEKIK